MSSERPSRHLTPRNYTSANVVRDKQVLMLRKFTRLVSLCIQSDMLENALKAQNILEKACGYHDENTIESTEGVEEIISYFTSFSGDTVRISQLFSEAGLCITDSQIVAMDKALQNILKSQLASSSAAAMQRASASAAATQRVSAAAHRVSSAAAATQRVSSAVHRVSSADAATHRVSSADAATHRVSSAAQPDAATHRVSSAAQHAQDVSDDDEGYMQYYAMSTIQRRKYYIEMVYLLYKSCIAFGQNCQDRRFGMAVDAAREMLKMVHNLIPGAPHPRDDVQPFKKECGLDMVMRSLELVMSLGTVHDADIESLRNTLKEVEVGVDAKIFFEYCQTIRRRCEDVLCYAPPTTSVKRREKKKANLVNGKRPSSRPLQEVLSLLARPAKESSTTAKESAQRSRKEPVVNEFMDKMSEMRLACEQLQHIHDEPRTRYLQCKSTEYWEKCNARIGNSAKWQGGEAKGDVDEEECLDRVSAVLEWLVYDDGNIDIFHTHAKEFVGVALEQFLKEFRNEINRMIVLVDDITAARE